MTEKSEMTENFHRCNKNPFLKQGWTREKNGDVKSEEFVSPGWCQPLNYQSWGPGPLTKFCYWLDKKTNPTQVGILIKLPHIHAFGTTLT